MEINRSPSSARPLGTADSSKSDYVLLVNKGFPIDDQTWSRMWENAMKCFPQGQKQIVEILENTKPPAAPRVVHGPVYTTGMDTRQKLEAIQEYMKELQYNHTGTQFFEIKKQRPMNRLMDTAKEIIREALPIKCLEAAILGIYLTNSMTEIERFTISFKTQFQGQIYRHIVLGIYHDGRYGALGLSRRDDLMYKPVVYPTLHSLLKDYERSYAQYWHAVKKVTLCMPIEHDPCSLKCIEWKYVILNYSTMGDTAMAKACELYCREMKNKTYAPSKSMGSTMSAESLVALGAAGSRPTIAPRTTKPLQKPQEKSPAKSGGYQIRV
eukprot:Colp12_sorted_trinity150504_noHs@9280